MVLAEGQADGQCNPVFEEFMDCRVAYAPRNDKGVAVCYVGMYGLTGAMSRIR